MSPLANSTALGHGIPPTFRWPVQLCFWTTLTTYVLSLLTGNVSQVDRVWTFLPVIYSAYFALLPYWPRAPPLWLFPYVPGGVDGSVLEGGNTRTKVMLALQILWMARLSYNTWRRGLFDFNEEDYRWADLRSKIPTWLFQVINLTFIAITQNILLFLLSIPTHNAATLPPALRALGPADYILASLSLLALALEFVADNQQHAYQTFKRTGVPDRNAWPGARSAWTMEDVQRGFVTRGLWAWSRHPNFACEQLFWILQALFPILATPGALSSVLAGHIAPLVPPLALCALFISSTTYTESISRAKYPEAYKAYQSRVAMFVPVLTPVWGWLLQLQGKKEWADRLVYGRPAIAARPKKAE